MNPSASCRSATRHRQSAVTRTRGASRPRSPGGWCTDADSLERFVTGTGSARPLSARRGRGRMLLSCGGRGRLGDTRPGEQSLLTASITSSVDPQRQAARWASSFLSLASTWVWSLDGIAAFEAGTRHCRDFGELEPSVVFGLLGAIAGGSPGETLRLICTRPSSGMIGAGVRSDPGRAYPWPADDRLLTRRYHPPGHRVLHSPSRVRRQRLSILRGSVR